MDEQVHFIEGRLLLADEESYYDLANRTQTTATLYEHCVTCHSKWAEVWRTWVTTYGLGRLE